MVNRVKLAGAWCVALTTAACVQLFLSHNHASIETVSLDSSLPDAAVFVEQLGRGVIHLFTLVVAVL